MSATRRLLAFDLGAESGRAMLGLFDGARLELGEVHRFANGPVPVFEHLYWDPLRLFAEMQQGLGLAAGQGKIDAIGIDTWGVDFALLGKGDVLLENPRNYRDPRTEGMLEAAFALVPREEIFARTGVQFMQINTLYQLLAMRRQQASALEAAQCFLLMADLFNFFLTGEKVCEFSNATTTQCYDPCQGRWATELLEKLGLPTAMLPRIVPPGTPLGPLLPALAQRTGAGPVPVIAPATHDTGSAVAAIPTSTRDFAYISSGTWSLMGAELEEPLVSETALAHNFTNEGGVGRTFRFLKNIMGLWLVQECRRTWERQGRAYSYAELAAKAAQAPAFVALIDPDHGTFLAPGDMPQRIRAFCQQSGQAPPADEGSMIRTVLESLVLRYLQVLEGLEEILGRRLGCIHIVGGGIQNQLLCQFTADATGRPVIAGPLEATAIGNLMVQAMGLGEVGSLAQARQVVARSFDPLQYQPRARGGWVDAYARFKALRPGP
ncbi:MAG: rhamnulokinase [Candidatus Handelsmanbacteria bacterium]|nr:rhamnulokinase [Candidatus Handelsmanbacteria bacterium]